MHSVIRPSAAVKAIVKGLGRRPGVLVHVRVLRRKAVGDRFHLAGAHARHAGSLLQIARDAVTLVFDKGSAALANTVELQEAGVGWISALPWNQAPVAFWERAVEQLPLCSSAQPGVRAAAEKLLVHGQEYLCVLKYSASFAGE